MRASVLSVTTRTLRHSMQNRSNAIQNVSKRRMGGGKYMHISETHTNLGEAFGVICWLWVFHRARYDIDVFFGWRHPWEHRAGDDDHHHDHGSHDEGHGLPGKWDKLTVLKGEDDEEEEEDETDEEEEED